MFFMIATVTWLGHASALVSFDDERVLIDPLGRRRHLGIPRYTAIFITHAHVDHLNRWTLSALDKSCHLVIPKGAGPIVADLGFARVTEVEPGDTVALQGIDAVCVPTRHDSGRWRKGDSPLCTGYVFFRDGVAIHHAGDVDMSDFTVFEDIGKKWRIQASLLPIGGMLPVWYYRWRKQALDSGVHVDPDTALEIAQILGAQKIVPVHWGTVQLRLSPLDGPKRRLVQIASERQLDHLLNILNHGETSVVSERTKQL